MFDTSLIAYFPRPGDGGDASVDEICGAVADWYAAHPGYRASRPKLSDLMRVTAGPAGRPRARVARGLPLLPARASSRAGTHGWNDTMAEYARTRARSTSMATTTGHRALFGLRPGESLVREAGNRGLHVNARAMPGWDVLKATGPGDAISPTSKDFFPGYRGGVVANGTHRYAPDLAAGDLAAGAEVYENLDAEGGSPALRPKDAGRPGVAVIPMASPYVYLGGRVRLKAVRRSAGDRVSARVSTDNGRSFKPLWGPPAGDHRGRRRPGREDPPALCLWLKVEIVSATPGGAGLEALASRTTSSMPPGRCPGSARAATRSPSRRTTTRGVATRSFAFRITPDAGSRRTRRAARWASPSRTSTCGTASCWWKGGVGTLTVPIEVPGDLVALRLSAQARARGAKDAIDVPPASTRAGRGARPPGSPGRRPGRPGSSGSTTGRPGRGRPCSGSR